MTEPGTPAAAGAAAPPVAQDPIALLRSREYVQLLIVGAIVGVPVAVVAYFFLKLVTEMSQWLFDSLPSALGFDNVPTWWPLPVLVVAGLLVAVVIDRLPGSGGHEPANGLAMTGPRPPIELPGIALAAFVTLGFGVVLGPEAPLIAIGSGVAVLVLRLLNRGAPAQAVTLVGAAGSFAAVSTLLGSPLLGAFLLMEVAGLGGPMLGLVLVPGLLAAGIGALVFIGLDSVTGFGTFSLAVPNIPAFTTPTVAEFLWAIVIGVLGAAVGTAIRHGARTLLPIVQRRRLVVTPLLGAVIALAAIVFDLATDHGASQVLFSGEDSLAQLIQQSSSWSVGALVLLILCKGMAYGVSLAGFRGGPTFPGMFIGAAGGMALSHAAGLPMIAGVAMGIGAMAVTMLGLPLTAVLLTAAFLQTDAVALMPLVIVSVVVAYVVSARLTPPTNATAIANAAAAGAPSTSGAGPAAHA